MNDVIVLYHIRNCCDPSSVRPFTLRYTIDLAIITNSWVTIHYTHSRITFFFSLYSCILFDYTFGCLMWCCMLLQIRLLLFSTFLLLHFGVRFKKEEKKKKTKLNAHGVAPAFIQVWMHVYVCVFIHVFLVFFFIFALWAICVQLVLLFPFIDSAACIWNKIW